MLNFVDLCALWGYFFVSVSEGDGQKNAATTFYE